MIITRNVEKNNYLDEKDPSSSIRIELMNVEDVHKRLASDSARYFKKEIDLIKQLHNKPSNFIVNKYNNN